MIKKILFFFLLFNSTHSKELTILHTNDLHSYFKGSLEKNESGVFRTGGYELLGQLINNIKLREKEKGRFVLLVDAGDFYSGTLFHSIAMRADIPLFPEYEFFNTLDYHAITLGNHEFDGKDDGFSLLMKKVKLLGAKVPIISTNYKIPENKKYPIFTSKMITLKNGKDELKVGILGALGPDGCSVSTGNRNENSFVGFIDKERREDWKKLITKLSRESLSLKKMGSEINILLLHGGGDEDELLAREVSQIDSIISGHTHQVYIKEVGRTVVSQAGHYGKYFGRMPLVVSKGRVTLSKEGPYHIKVQQGDAKSISIENRIKMYERMVKKILEGEKIYLNEIKRFDKDFTKISDPSIGTFIADRILKEIKRDHKSVDIYFLPNGLIRNPIFKDYNYKVDDLFNILPLGFHEGHHLGHRVVSFFLNYSDLVSLVDFLDIYSKFNTMAYPSYSSNLKFEIRKWGIPFINRVKGLSTERKRRGNLIKVATNSFLFSYLDLIKKKTFGVINIIPRGENGEPIEKPILLNSEISYFLNSFK
jgi:5'-nucleotidase/UDP-sugar diphosphatase